jgi:hypothetical protein
MATAEGILLEFSGFHQPGHERIRCRAFAAAVRAIPVDNKIDSIVPVIFHHQQREFFRPGNELSVYFQG